MKEELYDLADHIARSKGALPLVWQDWASEIEMAIRKMANREAQPVGFRYRHKDTVSWLYNDWRWPDSVEADQCQIEWLYTAPPAPAVPDDVQHLKNVQELYHKQEKRLFALAQRIKGASFDKYSHSTAQAIDVLEREIFGDDGDACRAAVLAAAPEGGNG
ncbi:hypothetical protein V6307_14910 [Serratia marcescens]|uniref:hypothetical protein n=1 Tax=Serratia marcescens TaxID=615 RepID=UPI003701A3C0